MNKRIDAQIRFYDEHYTKVKTYLDNCEDLIAKPGKSSIVYLIKNNHFGGLVLEQRGNVLKEKLVGIVTIINCPTNFNKIKLDLERLSKGENLN
ncbi:MAG: hypothetical protein AABY32_03825 [Nanoarchaeota archaeon]